MSKNSFFWWSYYKDKYILLIKSNPVLVTEIESALRCFSYLLSGRFNSSHIVSELIYSISSLLQFMNDIILKKQAFVGIDLSESKAEKLKTFLIVVEYIQVFFEFSAKNIAGDLGKWVTIATIQVIKTLIKLILLFRYGESIHKHTSYSSYERLQLSNWKSSNFFSSKNCTLFSDKNERNTFKLKRSGRLIKSLNFDPKHNQNMPVSNADHIIISFKNQLSNLKIIGQLLNIIRPIAHLILLAIFGSQSWIPFYISLKINLISLILKVATLTQTEQEKLEIKQEIFALLFYFFRPPFFDNYSKSVIIKLISFISEKFPFTESFSKQVLNYISKWQQVYFYNWSV